MDDILPLKAEADSVVFTLLDVIAGISGIGNTL